jgi:hypothetical protein
MKFWLLILAPMILLFTASASQAHNVISVNGNNQDHQHVYRRQQYGKPLQQGHRVQTGGGNGAITWGPGTRSTYGKSIVRRSGPIIDDKNIPPVTERNGKKRQFGSAVSGYGKPVRNN